MRVKSRDGRHAIVYGELKIAPAERQYRLILLF